MATLRFGWFFLIYHASAQDSHPITPFATGFGGAAFHSCPVSYSIGSSLGDPPPTAANVIFTKSRIIFTLNPALGSNKLMQINAKSA
jgi:hypothetical protein